MRNRDLAPTDGLSFGLLIGQMQAKVEAHASAIAQLGEDLAKVKERLQRLLILAVLWGVALAANVSTDRLSELLAWLLSLAFKGLKLAP